jgi:hypothetical protein
MLAFFRFIDDVDMKRTESEENLNRFFDHANNVHPTIKFTHETSRNNISFLNTYTTCENGFFILDEVFSVNTTCFVKTMIDARIVVLEQMRLIRRAWLYGILLVQCLG